MYKLRNKVAKLVKDSAPTQHTQTSPSCLIVIPIHTRTRQAFFKTKDENPIGMGNKEKRDEKRKRLGLVIGIILALLWAISRMKRKTDVLFYVVVE